MVTYTLQFEEYCSDKNKMPRKAGIYCVYGCTKSPPTLNFSPIQLIYIGESGNVYERLKDHEREDDWKNELKNGATLCYSFASMSVVRLRKALELMLIGEHNPICNTKQDLSKYFKNIKEVKLETKKYNILIKNDIIWKSN